MSKKSITARSGEIISKLFSKVINWAVKKRLTPSLFFFIGVLGAACAAFVLAISPLLQAWAATLLVLFLAVFLRLGSVGLGAAVLRAKEKENNPEKISQEISERVADFLLFFGLYLGSGFAFQPLIVMLAMLSSLPTIISLAGTGYGVERMEGGPFGKNERSFSFVIAAFILADGYSPGEEVVFAVLLAFIGLGALLTSWKRYDLISEKINAEDNSIKKTVKK